MPRCGELTKNIIKMIKIELEEWQVKQLRNYFGENDKTQTEHWAYNVFDKALKEQLHIPVVLLCGSFDPENGTSSATKCKCGREKWEHPKAL